MFPCLATKHATCAREPRKQWPLQNSPGARTACPSKRLASKVCVVLEAYPDPQETNHQQLLRQWWEHLLDLRLLQHQRRRRKERVLRQGPYVPCRPKSWATDPERSGTKPETRKSYHREQGCLRGTRTPRKGSGTTAPVDQNVCWNTQARASKCHDCSQTENGCHNLVKICERLP